MRQSVPRCYGLLWHSVFSRFFAILTVQAIIEQHDAAIGFLALLFIPILAIIPLIIMYQESASVDIDALNEFSGVTITEVKDENGYSNAGKSLDKSIDDRNGYATTSVHYIKDGKMYTDGVIIIHQGRAGLFSNGSNSLQPVLADK